MRTEETRIRNLERFRPIAVASSRVFAILPVLCLAMAALVGLASRAAAAFPDRPVHLLVPYPPGGPNDVVARLVADGLESKLGWQVVVENRPGGSGHLALISAARAPPDGYTLVLPGIPYAVDPSLFSNAGYTLDEFVPVSIVTKGPLVLVVHPSLGVKSVRELIALARSRPGKIDYGAGTKGTSLYLAAELFKQAAKVDMQHIPYNGTNDLIPDMLTGRVPVVFLSPLIAKQHVAAGKVLALGITSAQRSPGWPETPTIAEAGVPGYSMETWYAVLAPKGVSEDIIEKLSGAIAMSVKSPDVSAKLESLGNVPVGSTASEAATFIETEAKRWHQIVDSGAIPRE